MRNIAQRSGPFWHQRTTLKTHFGSPLSAPVPPSALPEEFFNFTQLRILFQFSRNRATSFHVHAPSTYVSFTQSCTFSRNQLTKKAIHSITETYGKGEGKKAKKEYVTKFLINAELSSSQRTEKKRNDGRRPKSSFAGLFFSIVHLILTSTQHRCHHEWSVCRSRNSSLTRCQYDF